jgi:hypothetical protein
MGLGICFDERYEPITCMMHNCADTDLASLFAMPVIVLQDNDRLPPTRAGVFNIAGVEVTVIAIIPTDWADALLLG